jgi:hypothetical protein
MRTTSSFRIARGSAQFAAMLLTLAAATCGAASITGSGRPATEERKVAGFSGISLSLPARVDVTLGTAEGLTITADDNVLPEIETVVEGGRLKLRFRHNMGYNGKLAIRIQVAAKQIEAIAIAGSGDVFAPALTGSRLAVSISGSGDARVGGTVASLDVSISGSGDVDASKLDVQQAKVNIAGSGDATVWARKTLKVNVVGSGDVRYLGDPEISRNIVGSGSVRRAGDSAS